MEFTYRSVSLGLVLGMVAVGEFTSTVMCGIILRNSLSQSPMMAIPLAGTFLFGLGYAAYLWQKRANERIVVNGRQFQHTTWQGREGASIYVDSNTEIRILERDDDSGPGVLIKDGTGKIKVTGMLHNYQEFVALVRRVAGEVGATITD